VLAERRFCRTSNQQRRNGRNPCLWRQDAESAIYVETNDVNPLNAGGYKLPDGTAYADIVEFFAANLNKEIVNGVVRPTLYLNDKMTNLLENGGAANMSKGWKPMASRLF